MGRVHDVHRAGHERLGVAAQLVAVDGDAERLGRLGVLTSAGVGDQVGGDVVGAHSGRWATNGHESGSDTSTER